MNAWVQAYSSIDPTPRSSVCKTTILTNAVGAQSIATTSIPCACVEPVASMATLPGVNVESVSTPEDEPTEPLASMATITTTPVESVSTPENDIPTHKRRKRKKVAYNTDGLYVTIYGVNPVGKQLYYNTPSTTETSRILFTLAVQNRLLDYWYKNRSANNLLNVINTKIVGSAIKKY